MTMEELKVQLARLEERSEVRHGEMTNKIDSVLNHLQDQAKDINTIENKTIVLEEQSKHLRSKLRSHLQNHNMAGAKIGAGVAGGGSFIAAAVYLILQHMKLI